MRVTFLGTAAANAYPLAFCRCENCERSRQLGGRSLRRRSSVLVNDDLLIDLGPDIVTGSFLAGCSLAGLRYCLQTHSHADHLDPSHFEPRTSAWAVIGAPRLHIYGSAATLRQAARRFQEFYDSPDLMRSQEADRLNLTMHCVKPQRPFVVGPYHVAAFEANHDPTVESLLYAVQSGGKAIFYGADTASIPEKTWRGFHRLNLQFDLVILDHTYGPGILGTDHLSADEVASDAGRLRSEGLLSGTGRVFATHISHEGNPPHPELTEHASKHGYEIAYDGLAVDLSD